MNGAMSEFLPLQLKHYLIFTVADQKFAFDINDIDSIHTSRKRNVFEDIDDLRTAVRLHKKVVPIINLRKKLGLHSNEPEYFHSLIFLKRREQFSNLIIGVQVDFTLEIVESLVAKKPNGKTNRLIKHRVGNRTEPVVVLRFKDIISEKEFQPQEHEFLN